MASASQGRLFYGDHNCDWPLPNVFLPMRPFEIRLNLGVACATCGPHVIHMRVDRNPLKI